MKDEIVEAFRHASQGFSPDRVVADPDLNRVYLGECSRLGLDSSAATLNRSLLNLRKRGALRGLALGAEATPIAKPLRRLRETARKSCSVNRQAGSNPVVDKRPLSARLTRREGGSIDWTSRRLAMRRDGCRLAESISRMVDPQARQSPL
jgi:hypothetical protein